jgi:tRNA modification GTPase
VKPDPYIATIFALATAPGRSGVAVFRVSGPAARQSLTALCKPNDIPKPREASLRKIHNPATGELIDHALVLFFEAPHSFTGEDVVEFHTHGGRAIAHALTDILQKLPGYRLAEPGEFTRRAFENGKMDLTEAEAIADLVDAETEAQRRQALRQMEGALGQLYEDWRARLIKALAYLEASIDFSDEDLPKDVAEKQLNDLRILASDIARHLDDRHRGERLRDGFSIAILGPPNAGKSSLLNALAKREAAIVSSTAGTTRDVIEVHLDLGGYPVTVADTAGLRECADAIESEGIRRALKRAEQADLKLLVFDGEQGSMLDAATLKLADDNAIIVVNKKDLLSGQWSVVSEEKPSSLTTDHWPPTLISAQNGEGIPQLLDRLIHEIDLRFGGTSQPPLTRARHRAALEECAGHLQRALSAEQSELRAEDVRLSMRALGRITGRVDVEDLLDIIFRDFCIGK